MASTPGAYASGIAVSDRHSSARRGTRVGLNPARDKRMPSATKVRSGPQVYAIIHSTSWVLLYVAAYRPKSEIRTQSVPIRGRLRLPALWTLWLATRFIRDEAFIVAYGPASS